MGERVFETTRVEQDGLRIELVVQPAVNYALVVNHVPVVRELTLTNRSELSVHGVALTLTIVGPSGPIAPPWTVHVPASLPPGAA